MRLSFGVFSASSSFGSSSALVLLDQLLLERLRQRLQRRFDWLRAARRTPSSRPPSGLLLGRRDLDVLALGAREHRLQRVEIGLQDRVELVVVAARAIDRHPQERLPDVGRDLGQHLLPALLWVDVAGHQVLGPGAQIPRRDQRLLVAGEQLVARDLLPHEAVVRLVRVEDCDHVIAIAPRVRAFGIQFEAIGVGVPDDVQPLRRPPLAIVRRRQQPVHHLLISVRRFVLQECVDLRRRRRQSGQIVGDPADQLRRGRAAWTASTASSAGPPG